jgi:hypothetical protein
MNLKQKKGVSGVITTLLIILLVLVALGITWVTIRSILEKGSSGLSLEQLTLDLDIRDAYIEDNLVKVNVRRGSGEGDLAGIKFIFDNGEETFESVRDIGLKALEGRTFNFTSGEVGGIDIVETVSVAPIFEEKTGSILDTETIRRAGGGISGGCEQDCTGLECGLDPICGASCGSCGVGEDCIGGSCVAGCVPDCAGKVCGSDGCGDSCGSCVDPDVCDATGQCIPPELCTDDCFTYGYNCGTWEICGNQTFCGPCVGGNCVNGVCISAGTCGDGIVQQPNGDGFNEECDGLDLDGQDCEGVVGQGYSGTLSCTPGCLFDTTGCEQDSVVNSGTVYSVWPVSNIYFDSDEFPTSPLTNYGGYWVRFPGSAETNCIRISIFIPPENPEIYPRSHVRLDAISTDIVPTDNYEVWETEYGCNNL